VRHIHDHDRIGLIAHEIDGQGSLEKHRALAVNEPALVGVEPITALDFFSFEASLDDFEDAGRAVGGT